MSIGADLLKPTRLPRRSYRLRRTVTEAASVLLGIALLIWSLLPVYNMLLIALDPEEGEIEFAGNLWTPEPSLDGFHDVIMQEARYLEDFWHQFGNSVFIGLLTMALTVLIGSLASKTASRFLGAYPATKFPLAAYSQPAEWFSKRDEIKEIIAAHLLTGSTAHWLSILEPADIWCARVME